MGTTTYAGIRKHGHDGCRFAPWSTVINFHFHCDLSQLLQITAKARTKSVSDMRSLAARATSEACAITIELQNRRARRTRRRGDRIETLFFCSLARLWH